MSAEASFAPEGIWVRVDAARLAVDAVQVERDAQMLRATLALVLADAVVDGEDLGAAIAEYSQARAAHTCATTSSATARDELRASRGVSVWPAA